VTWRSGLSAGKQPVSRRSPATRSRVRDERGPGKANGAGVNLVLPATLIGLRVLSPPRASRQTCRARRTLGEGASPGRAIVRTPNGLRRGALLSARKGSTRGQAGRGCATIARTSRIARSISVSEASSVRKAAWEVSVTFFMRARGCAGLSGSAWKKVEPGVADVPHCESIETWLIRPSPARGVAEDHDPWCPQRRLASMKPSVPR